MRQVALGLAHATQQEVNGITKAGTGSTPLHLASLVGDLAMVQMLLWVKIIMFSITFFIIVRFKYVLFIFSQMQMPWPLTMREDLALHLLDHLATLAKPN